MAGEFRVERRDCASSWDAAVWSHPLGSIFSASVWGRYKERRGYAVTRLAVVDGDGETLALAQVQERRRGPIRLVYLQGGPLFFAKAGRRGEAVMRCLVDHLALGRLDLLVASFEGAGSPDAVLAFLTCGFVPAVSPSHHTLEVDLSGGLAAVRDGLEPRWRKALAAAERNPDLQVRFLDDPDERLAAFDAFAGMYEALKTRKGFSNAFAPRDYRDLVAQDPRQLILEATHRGERVLVRVAHLTRSRCTDFFAASDDRARSLNAATLAVWRLVERAAALGCEVFDSGGIDPARNHGTYVFKRGLSRRVAPTGPLWLHGRSRLLTAVGGWALSWS